MGTPTPHPEIYPQNLSTEYVVVRVLRNRKEGGDIIQILQKEGLF